MSDIILHDLVSAWLDGSRRTLSVRFPAPLEARFEYDTRQERSRTLSTLGIIGFTLGVFLYIALASAVPDVMPLSNLLYIGISMPLGFVVSALVRLDPPPFLREGLTAFANLVCILTTLYLFGISHAIYAPYFVAGVTVLLVYSTIGVPLRFGFATATALVIILAYAAALDHHPEITEIERRNLLMTAAATATYLLVANWRLERETRRNYLCALRDRLQRQDLSIRNRELDELARRDPLTGLANRRAYDDWLETAWAQAKLYGSRVGLIVLDVDFFKAYNDHYGHPEGDRCLQIIARTLRDQLRGTSDLVARLGGEEFAVLLPGLPSETCADVAERMRRAVEALELPHLGRGAANLVTVSAGVASHIAEGLTPASALFVAADAALYEAKQTGRNRVCVGTALSGSAASVVIG